MKSRHALNTVAAALLLFGCASPSQVAQAPRVEPVVDLRHGAPQAEGYFELGRFFQSKGHTQLAIDAHRKALTLDGGLAEAHNALGAIYAGQGNYGAAIAEFDAAIAIDPTVSHFHSNLGYARHLAGNASGAVAALQQAVALDPANARARNNLGLAQAALAASGPSHAALARATDPVAVEPLPLPAMPIESLTPPPPPNVMHAVTVPRLHPLPEAAPATRTPMTVASALAGSAEKPSPTGWSVISEMPATVKVTEMAPNVLAFTWEGTMVVARPAAASDFSGTVQCDLEVANGNGVNGMARKVGQLFAAIGVPRARLTNQKPYEQQLTEIQYREGCLPAAAALSARLPNRPATAASDRLRPGTDVRLVLGKDLPADVALVPAGTSDQRWAKAAWSATVNMK